MNDYCEPALVYARHFACAVPLESCNNLSRYVLLSHFTNEDVGSILNVSQL